ncbi:MAG: SUMF1/EgtB/PvdO family nonheme iron enzyme [Planctomycetota bacterium]
MDAHPDQDPPRRAVGDDADAAGAPIALTGGGSDRGAGGESGTDTAAAAGDGETLEAKPVGASEAIGSVVARRYELTERLGSGRRGVVYLALDRMTEARVAVKRLRTDASVRDAVLLARDAAELQATIRHPGIARVFEVGEDASGLFIVSEYIDGPCLTKHVATHGPLDLSHAIRVIGDVGEAMIAAHDIGLFHGSVRGANVLLTPDGETKVVDFSIANIVPADHPKARRQDIRGLARTLCQLLTGVSRGTVNVHELPKPVRPVIRLAMGRSVATRQSTMEHFLRELRATDLVAEPGPLSEADAIRKGREAELSGSFAAMRAAGEEAQQANAESAEAMVLLRRADALESEKNELIRTVGEREAAFDYAAALEALGQLIRRFPADHHVIRLAGQKRQMLADLTRLSGLGEQMVQSGRIAESVDAWRRVLELKPDDPAAQVQVRLGRAARFKRRIVAGAGTAAVLAVLAGGGWFAWTEFGVHGLPRAESRASAGTDTDGLAESAPGADGDSRPAPLNPLIAGGTEALNSADRGLVPPPAATGTGVGAAGGDGTETADRIADGDGAGDDAGGGAESRSEASSELDERLRAFARAAEQSARAAASARGFAVSSGAVGLASGSFDAAAERHTEGQRLLETGRYAEAAGLLSSARSTYVRSAAEARARIAGIESLIAERRLRDAAAAIDRIRTDAPAEAIAELETAAAQARGATVELAPGVEVELRYVEPGVFRAGSDADEPGRRATEDPRRLRIARPFWMMATELTRSQLAAATGGRSSAAEAGLPATGLSLDDAIALADRLTAVAPGTFSIPTEAQWEYACRADADGPHGLRNGSLAVGDAAWWLANAEARVRPVATREPNAWGLYDMLGNAAELVLAPELGHGEQVAMTRGGSFLSPAGAVRAAARHELVPRDRGDVRTGVRFIWTPDEPASEGDTENGDENGDGADAP